MCNHIESKLSKYFNQKMLLYEDNQDQDPTLHTYKELTLNKKLT